MFSSSVTIGIQQSIDVSLSQILTSQCVFGVKRHRNWHTCTANMIAEGFFFP